MNNMLASRVKETSTTTGTGTYSLSGSPVAGFRTFASAFTSGQLVYYVAVMGTEWEAGMGFFTSGAPSTLSRFIVTASSNGGAAVDWGAGTKTMFCDVNPNAFYDVEQNVFQNTFLGRAAIDTFLLISGTAYFVYVGRTSRPYTAAYVEVHVTTAGGGAQTAEVGLFSSPVAPNKAGQTLTKIVATGTVDSLNSTGVKRNTTSFATPIPGGTHLWAAMRTAQATTQPTTVGLSSDMSQGHILRTTGGGALTGVSSAAAVLVPLASVANAPDLRVSNV